MFMLASLFSRIVTVFLAFQLSMYIIAIGWIYVVFMMSITERSAVAGVMTFLLYGVVPVTVILYLMGGPRRKRRRAEAEKREQQPASPEQAALPGNDSRPEN